MTTSGARSLDETHQVFGGSGVHGYLVSRRAAVQPLLSIGSGHCALKESRTRSRSQAVARISKQLPMMAQPRLSRFP
jgi:hypothetical protein